ncbi:DNA topoisomerase I, mitochondrial-like [Anneissia japonica]|uniref:DNA topoisomerase I, mitochondrial-like n=1 Tax=Anneissia japonica TaxID=1529436 RepID=UPI0014255DBA|nr:DNA topoisomerase I, mitochondrial-like [Anneissia japonica]
MDTDDLPVKKSHSEGKSPIRMDTSAMKQKLSSPPKQQKSTSNHSSPHGQIKIKDENMKKHGDHKHKVSSGSKPKDGSMKPKNGVSSSGDHPKSNTHNSSDHSKHGSHKQHSGSISKSKDGEKKSSEMHKKSSSSSKTTSNKSSLGSPKVDKHKSADKSVHGSVKVKKEPSSSPVKESSVQSPPKIKREDESKDKSQVKSEKSLKRTHPTSSDEISSKKIKVKEHATKEKDKKAKKRKSDEGDDDFKPNKKSKSSAKVKSEVPEKKKKKKEDEQPIWKWWEEEGHAGGEKWKFLEHKGPVFAAEYEPLPKSVKFYYDGEVMQLSEKAEEVAGFYARMLDHDYTTREVFNNNFFKDWRKEMTSEERKIITSLKKCNFKKMHQYFVMKSEERKNWSKEEKNKLKEKNAAIVEEYGFCTIDNHKEKIGNFKIEPPGLFRGRGEHPKQGMLKRRTLAEDVIINCSKDSKIPEPPAGHKWKQVTHDNKVSWLASWTENVQGQTKYVMLGASSRLKVGFYLFVLIIVEILIFHQLQLALRAGNEKDEETADTVGCCSLRVEHINLHEELDGKEYVVEFDFLGKDSIRYYNKVSVEKRAFKNLKLFMDNKQPGDDLFDRLNTGILNKYLQELMEGLTAKVFRTFNASFTLQKQLKELTNPDDSIAAKVLSYNRANRAVAILCNHQRAVPKTFEKSMTNLHEKIKKKKDDVKKVKKEYKAMKLEYKNSRNDKLKIALERKKKQVERLDEQLTKLEVSATDKEENKEIALGTSKLNYLDPRISVAWCKKWEVPLEKVYNKTQRTKFNWAIDMAEADYVF